MLLPERQTSMVAMAYIQPPRHRALQVPVPWRGIIGIFFSLLGHRLDVRPQHYRPVDQAAERATMRSSVPLRRHVPLRRRQPMKPSRPCVTASARATYQAATEHARTPFGYLRCQGCGRSLLDGQEQRHHNVYRSHGGQTSVDNIAVLCIACHGAAHHLRVILPGPLVGGCVVSDALLTGSRADDGTGVR